MRINSSTNCSQCFHEHNIWITRYSLKATAAAAAKSLQSCPTLCNPIDSSPPGFRVPGILQARTLEWVAISFSNAWKWKVKVKSLSRVRLCATPWAAAHQAPPSMGFSRQEYWSGVPLPSLRNTSECISKKRDILVHDHNTSINSSTFNIEPILYYQDSNFVHWNVLYSISPPQTSSLGPGITFSCQDFLALFNLEHFPSFLLRHWHVWRIQSLPPFKIDIPHFGLSGVSLSLDLGSAFSLEILSRWCVLKTCYPSAFIGDVSFDPGKGAVSLLLCILNTFLLLLISLNHLLERHTNPGKYLPHNKPQPPRATIHGWFLLEPIFTIHHLFKSPSSNGNQVFLWFSFLGSSDLVWVFSMSSQCPPWPLGRDEAAAVDSAALTGNEVMCVIPR